MSWTSGTGTTSSTGGYYVQQRQPRIGDVVEGNSHVYCHSCLLPIRIRATIVGRRERGFDVQMHDLPETCKQCGAPKPFLYPWEVNPNLQKPDDQIP